MAMSTAQAREYLLSLLPPGFTKWFDFAPGSFGYKILDGAGEQFALRISTPTDEVNANSNPWTLVASGLAAWEVALEITSSIPVDADARKAAIISRLREHGASTLPNIRAVVGPLLGYANPNQLEILEVSRDDLTTAHSYNNSTGASIIGGGTVSQGVTVGDDPVTSQAGARVIFHGLGVSDEEDITVTLTGPNGEFKTWAEPVYFRNASATDPLYLYAVELAGVEINGAWELEVTTAAGNVDFDGWDLVVEGIGWQSTIWAAEGLGSEIFRWAVQIDPVLEGVANPSDRAAAIRAIRRIKPAHTQAFLVVKMPGGGACAIVDEAIADACTCC